MAQDTRDWKKVAADFVALKEGLWTEAKWDYNAYRIGYGSDKIMTADGRLRDVVSTDRTTKEAAVKVLEIELTTSYLSRLVGRGANKISQQDFDALNSSQKAALISYVYNVGSLRTGIADAVRKKDYRLATDLIREGPVTATDKKTGKRETLPGLVKRRKEEADLFGSGAPQTPPKPTTISVGDAIAADLYNNYRTYIAEDPTLRKNTVNELLAALKKAVVSSVYTNVILSIGWKDAWSKPSSLTNQVTDPRADLVTQLRRVFPNAQFYIVNGTHGWAPEITAGAECNDDCWTKKVAAYILFFTDKGFKTLGQQKKLSTKPDFGQEFFKLVEDDMKKHKIIPDPGPDQGGQGGAAPQGQQASKGEYVNNQSNPAPSSQRNQLSSNGIVNLFPATIVPTVIKIDVPDNETQKKEFVRGLGYVPLVWYNAMQVDYADISYFSIYFDGILPHINIFFSDSLALIKDLATPIDNSKITIFINSRNDSLRPIHLDFKVKTYVNEGGFMNITAALDVSGIYYQTYKTYPGFTSNFVLQAIAKDLGLGFNTNIVETNDTMSWMATGERVYDFIQEVLDHAYISDESFISGNVDLYYNLNFVDVQKELSRDLQDELGMDDEALLQITDKKGSAEKSMMFLTNDDSMKKSTNFFSGYRITNRATDIALQKGYSDDIVYYDTGSKSAANFSVNSMNLNSDKSMVLKSGNDDQFFENNKNFVYAGKANSDNSHVNFNYTETHNDRNISEADKLLMEVELPFPNYNLYKFQKIRIIFSHNASSAATSQVNTRYSGDWMITDIRFVMNQGLFSQLVSLVKREMELTAEEVANGIVAGKRPTGRSRSDFRGSAENPIPGGGGGGGTPAPPGAPVPADDTPRAGKSCAKQVKVINQQNSPGVNISGYTPWSQIKRSFPIINGEVPVRAIGTPYDSGDDFAYKMRNVRGRLSQDRAINYIVIHYTVSSTNDATHHYRNTWESGKASSDFTIGRSGQIAGFKNYKNWVSWHYGDPTFGGFMNTQSIGFEVESYGPITYCLTTGQFLNYYGHVVDKSMVALTRTYRGHNMWHAVTNVQVSAIANLILALYNSGAITDKTRFIQSAQANGRYDTLFPDVGLRVRPAPGTLTHGSGRDPSGKIDIHPQQNLMEMLDDLPNLLNNNKNTIRWTR